MDNRLMNLESTLPFEKFLKQNPAKLKLEIAGTHDKFMITTYEVCLEIYELDLQYKIKKRYTEFAGLYDSLKLRYQNVNFPEFPSKYQVFNKIEIRKKFFNQLLASILNLAMTHQESKKELFRILFKFLTETTSDEGGKLYSAEKDDEFQTRKNSSGDKSQNSNIVTISRNSNQRKSENITSTINLNNAFLDNSSMDIKQETSNDYFQEHLKKEGTISSNNKASESTINNNLTSSNNNQSIGAKEIGTFFDLTGTGNNNEVKGWNIEYDFLRKGIRPSFHEILLKGFCKVEGKNLLIMESIATNNFFIIMPLWRAKVEFFSVTKSCTHLETSEDIEELLELLKSRQNKLKEFKLQSALEELRFFVKISHDCDKSDLIISLSQIKTDLFQLIAFIEILYYSTKQNLDEEEISKWKYIRAIDETNYYSYGKLKIDIDDMLFQLPQDINIFIKITLDPYVYRTKTIIGSSIFIYKQIFLIPIHNRFDSIKFEVFMENNVGFFHKKYTEDKICEFKIKIPDIINGEYDNQTGKDINIIDKESDVCMKLVHKEKGKIYAYIPVKNLKLDEKLKKNFPTNIATNQTTNLTKETKEKKDVERNADNISYKDKEIQTPKTNSSSKGFVNPYAPNSNSNNSKKNKNNTKENDYTTMPEKTNTRQHRKSIKTTLSSISTTSTNYSNSPMTIEENMIANAGMIVKIKVINLSSELACIQKNKNKFVLEEQYLKNDEDFSMKLLLKRLKKVVSAIKQLTIFYKDIFRWAYPVYSLIMMIWFILYLVYSDLNYLGSHLVGLLLVILISYSNLYQKRIKPILDKYITNIVNEYKQFNTEVLNLDDLEDHECLSDSYLISEEKTNTSLLKQLISPFKYYRDYKEKYNKILFKFSKFVSFLEKFKNLIFWSDPVLSLHFTIILAILYLLIINFNIRYLLLFSIIKKFISGRSFYRRKFDNNLEVTKIILENLYLEWISNKDNYKYLKKNIKQVNTVSFCKEHGTFLHNNYKSSSSLNKTANKAQNNTNIVPPTLIQKIENSNSTGNINITNSSSSNTNNENNTNQNNIIKVSNEESKKMNVKADSINLNKDSIIDKTSPNINNIPPSFKSKNNQKNNTAHSLNKDVKIEADKLEKQVHNTVSEESDPLSINKLNIYSLNLKQMSDDPEKIKSYIREYFEHHLDAVINNEFLNNISNLDELREFCEKSKSMLKIQKRSYIYKNTIKNSKLYKASLDVEDFLYYYILNVKSDLYFSKYYAKYDD